jgi:hypothetical protein
VLGKLHQHLLKASFYKRQFFQSLVRFLGFVISSEGLKIDAEKLSTNLDWPFPSSLKQLRQFLGFCNFYRRFIPKFSGLARPLMDLTKEGNFTAETIQKEGPCTSFLALKAFFSIAPLLQHFDFRLPQTVHVNSSDTPLRRY